jgi:hypothetical protein
MYLQVEEERKAVTFPGDQVWLMSSVLQEFEESSPALSYSCLSSMSLYHSWTGTPLLEPCHQLIFVSVIFRIRSLVFAWGQL